MTEQTPIESVAAQDQPVELARPERHIPPWALPAAIGAAVLAVGVAAGIGIGLAASDPTASQEYRALDERYGSARDSFMSLDAQINDLRTGIEAEAERAEDALRERAAAVDAREAAVAGREQAVTVVEEQIAARSIGNGIWTVGVDVEPGTYRVSEALTGYCYWSITRSGSNGDDIIENDGPTGGFPTVTLRAGQDFENSSCGTFVKQ